MLREPLLHFLLAGAGLFLLFNLLDHPNEHDDRVITVDRESLATFIQFRSRTFTADSAIRMLDAMDEARLEGLVRDYVQEEALYREALRLGLDRNDYIIRRRLVQSAEFVATGPEVDVTVIDDEISDYYEEKKARYLVPAKVTFTHVYFNGDLPDAEKRAVAMLERLNEKGVPFAEAGQYGDRFPYFLNYVERDETFVRGHFGREFAAAVFGLEQDPVQWTGPLPSAFGHHLLLLAARRDAYVPGLAEIREQVGKDLVREKLDSRHDEELQKLLAGYRVRRDL